jgi:hypothetical protein
MHDPVVVRGLQRLGDLSGEWDRVGRRNGVGSDPIGERGALDQLHHQVVLTDVVKGADVGMVQGRNGASFALETLAELLAADLDGHGAMKPGVARGIHIAHATRTDGTDDLEASEEGAGGEEHRCADYRRSVRAPPHSHEGAAPDPKVFEQFIAAGGARLPERQRAGHRSLTFSASTGLTSTIGVPFNASRWSTCTRNPSTATT